MEVVFWTFLILSVYPYLIYPGLVYLISKGLNRAWKRGDSISRVTLIISVYNEENVIEKKIGNALSLEYPEGLLEIIVVSDGSTDRTNEIVSGFKDPRLVFKVFPERSGKTACLNRVIPEAKGEIVVFTDANSMFPPDSVPKLVRNFLDNNVGLVTGWTKYTAGSTEEGTSGIYSRLEMKTKYWESLISSCVGADGAIFAIRKDLYRLLDDQDINDFVIPFHVLSQGKRVILDPDVYCFEEPSKGDREEYRRQARITNRTLRAILRNPGFLNPFSFGSFSLFLLSHKLLRFLVPFFITGAFFVNLLLIEISPIYISLFLIQILFFVLGLANLLGKVEGRLANFCKYFLITLLAQFTGWIRSIRGISDTMWTPKH